MASNQIRLGGLLVGLGALFTIPIIVLFLASGGPDLMGASMADVAATIAAEADAFRLVGALSIPANLMVILGALALTARPCDGPVPLAVAWYGVAVGFVLVMLYDLALPLALVPLAEAYLGNEAVFAALFRTFDLMHSVGLLLTFLALAVAFVSEAYAAPAALPRWWSYGAAVAAVLAIVLTVSFLFRAPIVPIAPSTFIVWLSLGVFGLRLTGLRSSPAPARFAA